MDASLGERLDTFAASLRAINPPFAEAVDRLVERLRKRKWVRGPRRRAIFCRRSICRTRRDASSRSSELLKNGPVAVVVHRGHWCPYCRINTRALAQARPQIGAAGGQVVAIVPDRQQYAAVIRSEAEADFPVLSDMDNGYAMSLNLVFWVGEEMQTLMSAAGVDLPEYQGDESWMVPVPATFVVDHEGRVKARFVDPDYRRRMTIESMMAAFRS